MKEGEPKDYDQKATEMWATFTDNERALVAIGMFPFIKMTAAERLGYEAQPLAVALMKIEKGLRS
jgi:hypothetical protein